MLIWSYSLINCSGSAGEDRLKSDLNEEYEEGVNSTDIIEITTECLECLLRNVWSVPTFWCNSDSSALIVRKKRVIDRDGLKWPEDLVLRVIIDIYELFQMIIGEQD